MCTFYDPATPLFVGTVVEWLTASTGPKHITQNRIRAGGGKKFCLCNKTVIFIIEDCNRNVQIK